MKMYYIILLMLIGVVQVAMAQKNDKEHCLVLKSEIDQDVYDSIIMHRNKKFLVNNMASIAKFDVEILSPDEKYVLAYDIDHIYTDSIYFFNVKGGLIKKWFIDFAPNLKFTKSGKYIEIFNEVGCYFYIFSLDGRLVKSGNYQEYLHTKEEFLVNFIYLEDTNEILFSTNKASYLFNDSRGVKFKVPGFSTFAYYDKDKKSILLNKVDFDNKVTNISLYDSILFNKVMEIGPISGVIVENGKIYISRSGKIFEYEIN